MKINSVYIADSKTYHVVEVYNNLGHERFNFRYNEIIKSWVMEYGCYLSITNIEDEKFHGFVDYPTPTFSL